MNFEDFVCCIRDEIFKDDIFYPPLLNFTIGQKNEEIILTFGEALNEVPIAIFKSKCKINEEKTDTIVCAKIRSELLRDDMDSWQINRAGKIISLVETHPEAFDRFFDNF